MAVRKPLTVRELPQDLEGDRICPVCQRLIQRNIFRYGNDLLHYGCYKKLKARESQVKVYYPHDGPHLLGPKPSSQLPTWR